jgi:3'-5' exoribonuclease
VRAVFLIQEIEIRTGDAPHTIFTFSHRAGRIRSAPFWPSDNHRIEQFRRGQAVEISGTIGSWKGRRQLNVESIRLLPPDKSPWDLLLPSIGDPTPWWSLIDRWRSSIRAGCLSRTVGLLFDDPDFRRRFERCPASVAGHHAKLGGLLQHTCEVAHLALNSASIIPEADSDLLLAGALLHDVGKTESYRWDGCFEFSDPGRAIGHVVLGARMVDRAVRQSGPATATAHELDLLLHLILAHHGKLEFGSPVLPLCLESELLCHADLTSARAASFTEALSDPDLFPENASFSTRSVWQLEHRRIWRHRSDSG